MKKSDVELKLNELMVYLNNFINDNGYPPTIREICNALSIRSTATAHTYLEKLRERGMIQKNGCKNRAIGICQMPDEDGPSFIIAPLIGEVACGSPIFAEENIEDYYPLPPQFRHGDEMFLLKARGESMIQAGINSGDKLICKKQQTANNGDIVVAMLDDSATVKRFFKKDDCVVLHPENPTYTDIMVQSVEILGKVVGLYRTF